MPAVIKYNRTYLTTIVENIAPYNAVDIVLYMIWYVLQCSSKSLGIFACDLKKYRLNYPPIDT